MIVRAWHMDGRCLGIVSWLKGTPADGQGKELVVCVQREELSGEGGCSSDSNPIRSESLGSGKLAWWDSGSHVSHWGLKRSQGVKPLSFSLSLSLSLFSHSFALFHPHSTRNNLPSLYRLRKHCDTGSSCLCKNKS